MPRTDKNHLPTIAFTKGHLPLSLIMFSSLGRPDAVPWDGTFLSVCLMSPHATSHCFVNPSWAPDTLLFIVLRNPPTVLSTQQLFHPWFWPEGTMPSTQWVCFCSWNRDSILKGWHFHAKAVWFKVSFNSMQPVCLRVKDASLSRISNDMSKKAHEVFFIFLFLKLQFYSFLERDLGPFFFATFAIYTFITNSLL